MSRATSRARREVESRMPARPSIAIAASPAYRRGVRRLLLGLCGFALIHLGMMVGCAAAMGLAVSWAVREPWLWPAAIVLVLVFAPLLWFLSWALFQRPRPSGAAVSIDAREHPRLLAL